MSICTCLCASPSPASPYHLQKLASRDLIMILLLSEWNMQITVDYCNSRSSATQPASSHPVRPPTFLRTNFALPIAAIQGWVLSIVFFSFSATQCVSESDDCHNTAKCGSLKRFSRRFSLPNEISLNWARETRDAAYGCVRPYRRSKLITRLIEQIRENSHSHSHKKKNQCVRVFPPSVSGFDIDGPSTAVRANCVSSSDKQQTCCEW